VAGLEKVARHRPAHVSDPDKANARHAFLRSCCRVFSLVTLLAQATRAARREQSARGSRPAPSRFLFFRRHGG
jgi:hypothetical protein